MTLCEDPASPENEEWRFVRATYIGDCEGLVCGSREARLELTELLCDESQQAGTRDRTGTSKNSLGGGSANPVPGLGRAQREEKQRPGLFE